MPVFGFIAVWTLWNYSKMSEVQTESGFYQLLFFYLVINSIFLPILAAVMASRLVDMETRGNTYKLLCTMQKKSSIFLNKLLLSVLHVLLFFLLEALLAVFLKNWYDEASRTTYFSEIPFRTRGFCFMLTVLAVTFLAVRRYFIRKDV